MRISDWSSDVCSSDLQSPIAILIAVIDAPPIARRPLDERRMAARPPFFGRRGGANERVAGAILPRPMDRPRARGDHHMAGRRTRRAADRGDHVIIVDVAGELQIGRSSAREKGSKYV